MSARRFVWLIPLVAVSACGDDGPARGGIPAACNPLGGNVGGACLVPFPSSAYLVEDAATRTGFRVAIPEEGMPVNTDGIAIEATFFNQADGFSPNAVIVAGFPGGVDPAGLPSPDDLVGSVGPNASIVIVEMATGARIPLFAEVDANVMYPEEAALLIRPLTRMKPRTRYAVAIRKSVRALGGGDLPLSPAFQALLDERSFDHPLMARLAPRYPEIFAALDQAGIPRSDLALAWDFVTASDEFLTGDLTAMRDQALSAMTDDGAGLTFDATLGTPAEKNVTLRYLTGTFDAPMFLSNGEKDDSEIVRDGQGRPVLGGTYRARFAAVIPKCVETTRPVPVVVFGHGLFGTAAESLENKFLQRVANDQCVVFVAGEWIGLTSRNVATAALAVNDINKGRRLTEKLAQAVINFMALSRIVRGPMAEHELFRVDGEAVIDPTRVTYYGASLGGIMGALFMSYEPNIELGVLGVPGANWTLLFERSFAWPALELAMRQAYEGPIVAEQIISLMGMMFDRYDPITTASTLVTDPITGVPPKKIFLYEGVGDCLVTNLATEMLARTMGIPVTGPSVYVPYGVEEALEPVTSGLTILDEHPTPLPPRTNESCASENGTHGDVNERNAVQRMVEEFFETGVLVHGCRLGGQPAPCDCATGACD